MSSAIGQEVVEEADSGVGVDVSDWSCWSWPWSDWHSSVFGFWFLGCGHHLLENYELNIK